MTQQRTSLVGHSGPAAPQVGLARSPKAHDDFLHGFGPPVVDLGLRVVHPWQRVDDGRAHHAIGRHLVWREWTKLEIEAPEHDADPLEDLIEPCGAAPSRRVPLDRPTGPRHHRRRHDWVWSVARRGCPGSGYMTCCSLPKPSEPSLRPDRLEGGICPYARPSSFGRPRARSVTVARGSGGSWTTRPESERCTLSTVVFSAAVPPLFAP